MKRLVLLLVLSGCGTNPPTPPTAAYPVKVNCIDKPVERPAFATDSLPENPSQFEKTKAIVLDWLAYRSYVPKLEAVQSGCVKDN